MQPSQIEYSRLTIDHSPFVWDTIKTDIPLLKEAVEVIITDLTH